MRAAAILLALLVALPARADTAVEKARAHYRTGEAHFRAGRYDEAIAEYQAAYALANRPELLFNIGSAYRKKAEQTHDAADKRAAVDYYRRYLGADPAARAAADATVYIHSLERELEEEAPASQPAAPPPAPVPPPPPPAVAPAPAPPAEAEADTGRSYRIAGLVAGGVGVALAATGVVFSLKAKSASDELAALQSGQTWNQDLYDSGQSAQRNAAICYVAGAAALAGGAVLYFIVGKPAPVTVQASAAGATVGFAGRF
jgi:tetratricopeptide (TPR) repeat protein